MQPFFFLAMREFCVIKTKSSDKETSPIVDLQVAVGSATLVARITRRSFQQLGIRTRQELYALIKAVSFDQRRVGYG
jgi:molybdopterin-binding protein